MYTPAQKAIIQELLGRLNKRRTAKGRPPTGGLPPCPGDPRDFYVVDNYTVRRHWRARPVRTRA